MKELSKSIDSFGKSAEQAADKLDPLALKEIFRALQEEEDKNAALEDANKKLKEAIEDRDSRGYILVTHDDLSLKLETALGAGNIFAELVPQTGEKPLMLFDGLYYSDSSYDGDNAGRIALTPQLRAGGHFLLCTWFDGVSGRITMHIQVRRGEENLWQALRTLTLEVKGKESQKCLPLWVGRSE